MMKKLLSFVAVAGFAASAGLVAQTPPPNASPNAQKRFDKADKDNNGKLTLEEFIGNNTKNKDKREKRFHKLDKNGAGVLTLDEFPAPSGNKSKSKKKKS